MCLFHYDIKVNLILPWNLRQKSLSSVQDSIFSYPFSYIVVYATQSTRNTHKLPDIECEM